MAHPSSFGPDDHTLNKILLEITNLRWEQAMGLFSNFSSHDAMCKNLWRLTQNMAAAQKHRALLYNQLARCIEQGQLNAMFQPALCDDGICETVACEVNGKLEPDHPHENPAAWAKRKVEELCPALVQDQAIALVGLRDGHLLTALNKVKSPFKDRRTVPVFVIEPEAGRLLACFQIHDWSADDGPLAHPAFDWIAGADWAFELRNRLEQDALLPVPGFTIGMSPDTEKSVIEIGREISANRLAKANQRYLHYCERKRLFSARATVKNLLDPPKGRTVPPKVLIIGNRFSAESRRLSAEIGHALASLGWKTSLLIEASDRQRLTLPQIHDHIGFIGPSMVISVFQPLLDAKDSTDPNTPILRWGPVPDDATGHERFVRMNAMDPLSREHLDVGDRALILPGIMPSPVEPAPNTAGKPAVAVFGSIPAQPMKLLRRMIEANGKGPVPALMECAGHALMCLYEQGKSISTPGQMDSLVSRYSNSSSAADHQDQAARRLWPLNEALYLLQTVQWAAKACKDAGADLHLYGDGWDAHPDLARHHQKLGRSRNDRMRAVQNATLCVHAQPKFCLNEQTLSLMADGAFLLLREHPFNTALPELAGFLAKHAPNAHDTPEVEAGLAPDVLAAFKTLMTAMRNTLPTHNPVDPIALVRSCARGGVLDCEMKAMPHLGSVSFSSAEQLAAQISHWGARPKDRLAVTCERQTALLGRLGAEAALQRAIFMLARRYATQS